MSEYRLKHLSKHFCERWCERVSNGVMPQMAAIRQIIKEGIITQSFRVLYTAKGEPQKILATFWHPPLNVTISLDKSTGTAVSVLSEKNMPGVVKPHRQKAVKKVKFNKRKPDVWPGQRRVKREVNHAG